jgi:heme/copper-type cytochrome/quinol oxidase subunit 3
MGMAMGAALYFHGYSGGGNLRRGGLFMTRMTMGVWWRDVVREGTMEGQHTTRVQLGLRMGMRLFIVSEVRFFVAFFWAFFWAALSPTPEIGSVWPPKGIEVLNAWEIPFLNTRILLTSGASVTWAHHARADGVDEEDRDEVVLGLRVTVGLATIFTLRQVFEYVNAPFTISDSVYGSTFYMATGFHGFHVFIGTVFLAVCRWRVTENHMTKQHHFGLEAAAWYWHFVDVVWLFLFVAVYWWSA